MSDIIRVNSVVLFRCILVQSIRNLPRPLTVPERIVYNKFVCCLVYTTCYEVKISSHFAPRGCIIRSIQIPLLWVTYHQWPTAHVSWKYFPYLVLPCLHNRLFPVGTVCIRDKLAVYWLLIVINRVNSSQTIHKIMVTVFTKLCWDFIFSIIELFKG